MEAIGPPFNDFDLVIDLLILISSISALYFPLISYPSFPNFPGFFFARQHLYFLFALIPPP